VCIRYNPPSKMTTIVQSSNEDDDLSRFRESDKITFVLNIPRSLYSGFGELKSKELNIKGPGCKNSSWRLQVSLSRSLPFKVSLKNLTDEDILINITLEDADFKNDTLKLIFEISGLGYDALSKNYHQGQLSQHLNLLFTSNKYADITIECGDKKFKCHKIILASRSPVFKTMFDADMKEKEAGSVEIKNMTPEVLKNMLKYIYTSEAPDIDAFTQELFAAAEQYQLENLKELCEAKLCKD